MSLLSDHSAADVHGVEYANKGPVLASLLWGLLQWGRSFLAAEGTELSAMYEAGELTSMGPQLFSCGRWTLRDDVLPYF